MEAIEAVDFYSEPYPSPHTGKVFSGKVAETVVRQSVSAAAQGGMPGKVFI